jgi:FAD/FMN-containing dehydrogenase
MSEFRTDYAPLVPPGGIECHERDMTATVSADVTLAALQQRLAHAGQWLPVDGDPQATVGRLVESNSTGPLRLGYGAWRDLLLGCQFHSGRGELVTAGGRTLKNVAGYDLTKFMIGQRGVFGRVITVTTRTYRRPEAAAVARFEADARAVGRLLISPCRPQWAVLTRDALWCGYLGDGRTVEYYLAALPEHGPVELVARSPEEDSAHRRQLWNGGEDGTFRASVPPARIEQFVRDARLTEWSADAAFGVVVGPAQASQEAIVSAAAVNAGGSVYFMREGSMRVQAPPATMDVLRRLKAALDPEGRLEPLPGL